MTDRKATKSEIVSVEAHYYSCLCPAWYSFVQDSTFCLWYLQNHPRDNRKDSTWLGRYCFLELYVVGRQQ